MTDDRARLKGNPEPPDRPGWWLWSEGGDYPPVRLLIVGDERHTEVASDDQLVAALAREIDDDENYWEMTSTRLMPGLWMFDGMEKSLS